MDFPTYVKTPFGTSPKKQGVKKRSTTVSKPIRALIPNWKYDPRGMSTCYAKTPKFWGKVCRKNDTFEVDIRLRRERYIYRIFTVPGDLEQVKAAAWEAMTSPEALAITPEEIKAKREKELADARTTTTPV